MSRVVEDYRAAFAEPRLDEVLKDDSLETDLNILLGTVMPAVQ